MTFPIQRLAAASTLALSALALSACANFWDIHAPKTVTAGPDGGAVTVKHGQRLLIQLADWEGYAWRRMEPQLLNVVIQGLPDEHGMLFTPVRSGEEKLRFEYWKLDGAAAPERAVSYDITVR